MAFYGNKDQIANQVYDNVTNAERVELIPGGVGASTYDVISQASTNGVLIGSTYRKLLSWHFFNNSAATKWVKLYNKATAPTVGTDTPVKRIGIPAGGSSICTLSVPYAIFPLGLGIAITGASPDTDTTAVALGDVVGGLEMST